MSLRPAFFVLGEGTCLMKSSLLEGISRGSAYAGPIAFGIAGAGALFVAAWV